MTQPPVDHDLYAILGVPPDATRDAIRDAHRRLSGRYASGDAGEGADERLREVNEAYELLASPSRRRSYDRSRDPAPTKTTTTTTTAKRAPLSMSMPVQPEELFRFELVGEHEGHRRTLQRMLFMYIPLTFGALALGLIPLQSLLGGRGGAVIPLVIIGVLALALAFQALTALRDVRSQPMFTRGEVQRSWTKGGLLWFFRSHFVMVQRQVFVVPPEMWVRVGEGEMVELHHWPHTRTVIRMLLLHGSDDHLATLDSSRPTVPL